MAFDLAFDEGGEGNSLLVSMQLAKVDRAKKLKRHWEQKLNGVEYFHSKEYRNISHGVFKGLNHKQRSDLLKKLSTLIHRHISIGFTARVDVDFYNKITTPNFRSRWGTAYTFAVNMLAMSGYLYFNAFGLEHDVNVLIEDGHRHSAQALETINDAKKMNGAPGQFLKILTAGVGSKQDHPILQSADMLVYGEWQKAKGGDLEIYDALHVSNTKYRTEFFDIDKELIDSVTAGAKNWLEKRKAFGQRRSRLRGNVDTQEVRDG